MQPGASNCRGGGTVCELLSNSAKKSLRYAYVFISLFRATLRLWYILFTCTLVCTTQTLNSISTVPSARSETARSISPNHWNGPVRLDRTTDPIDREKRPQVWRLDIDRVYSPCFAHPMFSLALHWLKLGVMVAWSFPSPATQCWGSGLHPHYYAQH